VQQEQNHDCFLVDAKKRKHTTEFRKKRLQELDKQR